MPSSKHQDPAPEFRLWATAFSAGSALTGPILLGLFLDWQFGWSPWGLILGAALGLLTCGWYFLRMTKP